MENMNELTDTTPEYFGAPVIGAPTVDTENNQVVSEESPKSANRQAEWDSLDFTEPGVHTLQKLNIMQEAIQEAMDSAAQLDSGDFKSKVELQKVSAKFREIMLEVRTNANTLRQEALDRKKVIAGTIVSTARVMTAEKIAENAKVNLERYFAARAAQGAPVPEAEKSALLATITVMVEPVNPESVTPVYE